MSGVTSCFCANESIRSPWFGAEFCIFWQTFCEVSWEEIHSFPRGLVVGITTKSSGCWISRTCVKWLRLQKDLLCLFTWLLFCIIYPTTPVFLPSVLERYSLIHQKIELKLVKLHGFFSSERGRDFSAESRKGKQTITMNFKCVSLLWRLIRPESHCNIKTFTCV